MNVHVHGKTKEGSLEAALIATEAPCPASVITPFLDQEGDSAWAAWEAATLPLS